MSAFTRTATLIKAAMVIAMCGVLLIAFADLRREQAHALDDFLAHQSAQARGCAEAMRGRLDAARRDLETAADALDRAGDVASVHRRLLDGEGAYRELEVVDAAGKVVSSTMADDHDPDASSPALTSARAALLTDEGQPLAISPPVSREDGISRQRLRFFRLRAAQRHILLLVDLDRMFAGISATIESQESARWILVDDERRWLEVSSASDPGRGSWRAGADPMPDDLRALLAAMADGRSGAMVLWRDAAESLGLGHRVAVAGYAAVPTRLGRPWSLALVTSARRMRDRGRFATWRLVVSMGLAGLLVALFGVITLGQQRRAQQLAQALHLVEATSALRERSEKMIESIPMGILALDEQLRVKSVNPYLAERGVSAAPTLRAAFPHASMDELAVIEALVHEASVRKTPAERLGLGMHLDARALRDLDVYAIPLARPLAGVDCFVALHDRTEVRALERTLVRAEKLATIGTLAAGVAHEVGTPLGIISGRTEQLLERAPAGEDGDAARKNLSSIMAQVEKVSKTIRQLLDFARLRPIEAATVTPAQALQNAAALLDHRFRHARVTLHVDAPPHVPAISADPGQLEQVLVNLLINACDACAAGGNVWVCAGVAGSLVSLEVRDDGVGIPPENLALVLDPFFTTKKRGEGTGLGLSVAADIVKNHGGTLEVESVAGEGTTMRVFLPRLPETDVRTS